MLETVDVGTRCIDCYADRAGPESVAQLRELASALRWLRVLHLNATPYAGVSVRWGPRLPRRAAGGGRRADGRAGPAPPAPAATDTALTPGPIRAQATSAGGAPDPAAVKVAAGLVARPGD